MKKKPLPGVIGVAAGFRDISSLIGYEKCQPGIRDIPVLNDVADRFNSMDWKARGEEIHDAIRQASAEILVRNQARDKAVRDLDAEIMRAANAYRKANSLTAFSPEMFSMCRRATDDRHGWVVSNDTGETVCEWRWNELRFEGAKAIMSFNFRAFDGLTTKDEVNE